jgi:hypothetical protein
LKPSDETGNQRMTSADRPDAPDDMPALYEIRIRGAFDQKWRGLMEGMTLKVVHEEAQPVTVIRVVVRDQAALAGLLDALFGLNARVLSVTILEAA